MKSVAIYKRNDKYYLVPQCLTEMGIGIACGEHAIAENSDAIYELLMRAFEESREGVPHPVNWSEFRGKFFSIFGVKSSSAFHKNTLMITVDIEGEAITLTPYINCGAKNGFQGAREKAVRVDVGVQQTSFKAAIDEAFSLASS